MNIPGLTKQHLAVLTLTATFPNAPETWLAHRAFERDGISKDQFAALRREASILLFDAVIDHCEGN